MLRRPRPSRLLATIACAGLALVSALAPAAVACPMSHAARDASPPVALLPEGLGGHDVHQHHDGDGRHDAPGDADGPLAPCDCLHWCCSAPVIAPAIAAHGRSHVAASCRAAVPRDRFPGLAASRTHLLPFAQAPPA